MVKIYHSAMVGAPALSGTAGALIAILDACLVNGWGSAAVDSIVISGGIATVTKAAGHPMEEDAVAEITGATVTGGSINGEKKVLTATATQYTFDATGIPNQTATGSITHKLASMGWAKAFSGTNKAAYRASDITGVRNYLRVDDSAVQSARVVAYESMTDVDTGTNPYPTTAQMSGGGHWCKHSTTTSSATARPWVLIGDEHAFYLQTWPNTSSTTLFRGIYFFGDIATISTHAYRSVLHYSDLAYSGTSIPSQMVEYSSGPGSSNSDSVIARSASGVSLSPPLSRAMMHGPGNGSSAGTSGGTGHAYPDPYTGFLILSKMYLGHTSFSWAGWYPGFYAAPQVIGSTQFANRERLTGVYSLPGKRLIALQTGSGWAFIDLTSWR